MTNQTLVALDSLATRRAVAGVSLCGSVCAHRACHSQRSDAPLLRSWHKLALFPPHTAAHLIANRVRAPASGFFVASAENDQLAHSFHTVFHLGVASGLANDELDKRRSALMQRGWHASIDTLRRYYYATSDSYLRSLVVSMRRGLKSEVARGTVGIVIVRDFGVQHSLVDFIGTALELSGFAVVRRSLLSPAVRQRATRHLRGGDWGQNAYMRSAGDPAYAFVLFDPRPHRKCPEAAGASFVSNCRLSKLKTAIRAVVNEALPDTMSMSIVHSTDDKIDAREYIATLFTPIEQAILEADIDILRYDLDATARNIDAKNAGLPLRKVDFE